MQIRCTLYYKGLPKRYSGNTLYRLRVNSILLNLANSTSRRMSTINVYLTMS